MGISAATKAMRLAAGMCQRCGIHPFRENSKTCESCFLIIREYEIADRVRRKEKGICQKCPSPVVDCKTFCEKHLSYGRNRASQLQKVRLEEGLCTSCGNPRGDSPGSRECGECFAKHKETKERVRRERQAARICVVCGREKSLSNINFCQICYFKNLSLSHFSSNSRFMELSDLFDRQGGLCAILGDPLTIGGIEPASLDHIVPKSRGGSHDIANLRFVHNWINTMKGELLDEEFLPHLKSVSLRLQKRFLSDA